MTIAMLRRFGVIAAPLLFLAACVTAQQAGATVKQVQDYTALACAFEPTAAVVTSIFSKSGGDSVAAIGGAICKAVSMNVQAEGNVPGQFVPKAYGVVIKGRKLH